MTTSSYWTRDYILLIVIVITIIISITFIVIFSAWPTKFYSLYSLCSLDNFPELPYSLDPLVQFNITIAGILREFEGKYGE